MKKVLVKAAVLLFAMVLACGVGTQVNAKVKVKSVSVKSVMGSSKVVYVAKGRKVKLSTSVTVNPNKGKYRKVKFSSNKKDIATVSNKGVIKGKNLGRAKVKVVSQKNKKKKAAIKVIVVNPVKKVTISSKRASIFVDDVKKLTAKVYGKKKNFCKYVKWSSSNSKVATVSANGAVKAVGVGKTVITVRAIDGTGKKATCAITVGPRKTSILSISFKSVFNATTTDQMYVSLNQPKALTANDFIIKAKSTASAQYMKSLSVMSVTTTNNKDYIIDFTPELNDGNYVQVTVNALDGVKTMEQCFKASQGFSRVTVLKKVGNYVSYTFGDNTTTKIESGTLPAGLYFDEQKQMVYGTFSAFTNNQKVVFAITNEYGAVTKKEYNFVVGDASHIAVVNETFGDLKSNSINQNRYFYEDVNAIGGSGDYIYQLINNCNNAFTIDPDDGVIEATSGTLQPGTYYPVIRVVDNKNNAIYGDATWAVTITKGSKVTLNISNSNRLYGSVYMRNIETDDYRSFDLDSNGSDYNYLDNGTYDIYYYTYDSNGKSKINYLAKNVVVTQDLILNYTLQTGIKLSYNLVDVNNQPYTNGNFIVSVYSTTGEKLDWSDEISYSFNGNEPGYYYLCVYDSSTGELLGKVDTFNLYADAAFTIKLNKANS